MSEFLPEGKLINTRENIKVLSSPSALREAMQTQKILEATAVLCDSGHNLTVRLGSFRGIIPREEGAVGIKDGSVRDIAVISRVNRPVCFVVTDIKTDQSGEEYAVLSREKAQKICLESYISKLRRGDVVTAAITHLLKPS